MQKAKAAAAAAAKERAAQAAMGRRRKILRDENGWPIAEIPQLKRAWAFLGLPEGTRRFTVTYEIAKKCREARAELGMTQRELVNLAMSCTTVVPYLERSGNELSITSVARVVAVLQGEKPVVQTARGSGKRPVPRELAEQMTARRHALGLGKEQVRTMGHFSSYTLRDIERGNMATPGSIKKLARFYDDYEKRETAK